MDYVQQLKKQLYFLKSSCKGFDDGHVDEGIRIAVSARVLLHDTKTSTSLLSHLNANDIKLLTTTNGLSENTIGGMAFGSIVMSNQFSGYTINTKHKGYLSLSDYLNQILFAQGCKIRRRDIILGAANKDGGAHVDSKLTDEYGQIAESGSLGVITVGDVSTPIDNSHLIALRQIGYELLNSDDLLDLSAQSFTIIQ